MVNPRSDADLLRVINTPARGIGDTTIERVTDFANHEQKSLFEVLAEPARIPQLNSGAVKRLVGLSRARRVRSRRSPSPRRTRPPRSSRC